MSEEQELLEALAKAAREFNDAIEAVVENTSSLIVSVNVTTQRRHGEIGRKAARSIEAVEYTVTREIAAFEVRGK